MRRLRLFAITLKTRIALGAALLFALVIVALTAFQLRETRAAMSSMLSAQQTTLVTRAAEDLDTKFEDRGTALARVGEAIAPHLESDPNSAFLQLREHGAFNSMFDITFIFSPEGRVLAAQPDAPELHKLDVSKRTYFRATLETRRPHISAPYRSSISNKPFVMMTSPMYDSDGKLIGVLAGAINLTKPNFLGEIGGTPVGRSGYFHVVTRGPNPLVVAHPDPKRILGPLAGNEPDSPAMLAQGGFEGTIDGTNSRGQRGLFSYKRLTRVDWVFAAMLPAKEAFAPIEDSQKRTLAGGLGAAAVVGLGVWLLVRRALRPLDALRRNVRGRLDDPAGSTPLAVLRQDEIGQLTLDFNRLMDAQRDTAQALADSQERMVTITDNVPVLIGYLDASLRYQFNNQAYEAWFGLSREELRGRHFTEVADPQACLTIRPLLEQALQGFPAAGEFEVITQGRKRYVQATYLPHYGRGEQVIGVYVLKTDLTARKAAQDKLDYLAHHDALTGLLNRAAFNHRAAETLARAARNHRPCAMLYLDIDKFKSINDTRGHGIGDALLKEFSARLLHAVRKTDVVSRLGGDEFVVLLEDLPGPESAALVAAKIVQAMRAPFELGGDAITATASVGLAVTAAHEQEISAAALLERADAGLYSAKAAGRNTFRAHEPAGELKQAA